MTRYILAWAHVCLLSAFAVLAQADNVTTSPRIFITPADIQRAKAHIARYDWARQLADEATSEAQSWLARSDQWIRDVTPKAGACFAYGFTGCPICGGRLGYWADADATFDDPGHVKCANKHRLPDDDHPDTGTGYLAKDGRIHYFVGSYNAWVVEQLTFKGAENLALAYTLTGDERYAEKAAVILDALAAVYAECNVGSWDYPEKVNTGRFNRPQYQVARVLVYYVGQYDQIRGSRVLDAPSVRPGFTRRSNIEEQMIRDGGAYCHKMAQKGGLHNGTADYQRGALAAGIAVDQPDWIRYAVDGPYGILSMLENNVGRDGTYYETASGYSDHARGLYTWFAEALVNYRGAAYPSGVKLYAHPKMRLLMRLHNLAFNCLGRLPSYGDWGPLLEPPTTPQVSPLFDASDYHCLEQLHARTPDLNDRSEIDVLLRMMVTDPMKARRSLGKTFQLWNLFHATWDPKPASIEVPKEWHYLDGSNFLGQKGFAFLRTGPWPHKRAAMMRYGPSLNHGHLDDLNLQFFAEQQELTYDMGYALGSAHSLAGWSKLTASHNLVVVNEKPQLESGATGGSLNLFADLPSVKVAEASSENSYTSQGVELYRRTVALITSTTGTDEYLLDIFRVKNGSQHDYMLHARSENAQFEGVSPGPEEPGSLAGPDICWGDKIQVDGDIAGYPNKPYWIAPPGNGYGFLVHPRRAKPAGAWSADWALSSSLHMRASFPAGCAQEMITSWAPGITPKLPKARYVVMRRKGEKLASEFIAAIEAHSGKPLIERVEQLQIDGEPTSVPAVAVKVLRTDGVTDIVYSSADNVTRHAAGMTFAGRFIHARMADNTVQSVGMAGATHFEGFGVSRKTETDVWRGKVLAVDAKVGFVEVDAQLPAYNNMTAVVGLPDGTTESIHQTASLLTGKPVVFSNPAYSRSTAYRITRIEPIDSPDSSNPVTRVPAGTGRHRIYLNNTMILGRGQVGEINDAHTLVSPIVHEYTRPVKRLGDSLFFKGKMIRSESGGSAVIRSTDCGLTMAINVSDTTALKQGDVFHYYDIQPGDKLEILSDRSYPPPLSDLDFGAKDRRD